MQEVKEEKSGEAGKESGRKGRQRLAGAEETARSFHQKKETEKQPSSPPSLTLPDAQRWVLTHKVQGALAHPPVVLGTGGSWILLSAFVLQMLI